MPWTCLPGEPSNVNWCNGAGGADLYKNPPLAWRGANQHGAHTPQHAMALCKGPVLHVLLIPAHALSCALHG